MGAEHADEAGVDVECIRLAHSVYTEGQGECEAEMGEGGYSVLHVQPRDKVSLHRIISRYLRLRIVVARVDMLFLGITPRPKIAHLDIHG